MREQICDDCIAERNLHSLFLTVTLYIVSLLSSVYTKGLSKLTMYKVTVKKSDFVHCQLA